MDSYSLRLYTQIMRTFWRIFLILLGIAFLVIVFPYIKEILFMLIIAGLMSIILTPLVNYMESKGIKRSLAILIIMLLIIASVALSLRLIIPGMIRAVENFSDKLQSGMLADYGKKIEEFFARQLHNAQLAQNVTAKLSQIGTSLLKSMGNVLQSAGSFLASILIIPFIAFFFIKDGRKFKKALISLVPNRYFELSLNIFHKTGTQLSHYLRGQVFVALEVAILSIIGLGIINIVFHGPVPYFVFVGTLAGLANLIPYLGPFVGAVPALLLAVLSNPPNLPVVLLWIVVTFVVVQLIDNTIFSPLLISLSVNVHPLTVIVVVLIGGKIAGAVGMLFAVPFWGVCKVISSQIAWGLKNYKLSSPEKGEKILQA